MQEPRPAKFFCGLLTSHQDLSVAIKEELVKNYGEIDHEVGPLTWEFTDYYMKEMGGNLKKYFFSFSSLFPPDFLIEMKLASNEIEKAMAETTSFSPRPVNLDPGYITPASMVLASTKPYSHRIYLGRGIYAQVDYLFSGKEVVFNPWVYPDYKTPEYLQFFSSIRQRLLDQLKQ